jgi:two-component system response regulator
MNYNEVEILLVEDNPYDAEMTIRALKKVNLANKLVHLQNGEEAINFLFGKKEFSERDITILPKVILLDIKMPKVDGIEILRQIKASENTRKIPVVIMTSSKEEQDIINSYAIGVNSYEVKPVDFEGFAKAVSQLGLYWILTNQAPVNQ